MSIIQQFETVLHKYATQQTKLIAAVSGGSDSMALLDMLHRSGYNSVTVVHLNHQLRKEAARDEKCVRQISKQYGYDCICESIDIKNIAARMRRGIEETARMKRYEFFERVRKQTKAKWILTAHHQDDQAETIIMNMIRGSGVRGLMGMTETNGHVLRPLLGMSKRDLKAYAKKHRLKWHDDASNAKRTFTRNRIRTTILPEMLAINPALPKSLTRMSEIFSEIEEYMEQEAMGFIKSSPNKRYDMRKFMDLPHALQTAILLKLFGMTHGNLTDLSASHVNEVMKMLLMTGNKQKEFGKGATIKKTTHYFTVTSL